MIINLKENVIKDYIDGKEIDNIDELEEDYKFMEKVISISGDKNMYNLCSENVRNNYEFIKFMISTFTDDKDFIHKVAMEYLETTDKNDITFKELVFIMSDIFNNKDDKRALYYNLKRTAIYESERYIINEFISEEFTEEVKRELGLGFIFIIKSDLNESSIVTKYFAKKLVEEIFYEKEGLSLEELIHSKINNTKKIENIGIKAFIIEYVRNYDYSLADYLFLNNELVNDVEKDIKKVINNWSNYQEKTLNRKMWIFEQEANELIEKYNTRFDFLDICIYIDKKLNLPVKLNYITDNNMQYIDLQKITLNEWNCINKIVILAKDLFSSPIIEQNYMYEQSKEITNGKSGRILKFKSNK